MTQDNLVQVDESGLQLRTVEDIYLFSCNIVLSQLTSGFKKDLLVKCNVRMIIASFSTASTYCIIYSRRPEVGDA